MRKEIQNIARMSPPAIAGLFVLLTLCFSTGVYAGAVLEFTVHSEKTIHGKNEKKQETIDSALKVALGTDWFGFSEGGSQSVYDLSKRRVFMIDRKRNIYNDESLFMVIGFRQMELQNRLAMEAAFKAAKIPDKGLMMKNALKEHLFSILMKDSGSIIAGSKDKEAVSFASDGTTLMSWSLDGTEMREPEMRQFAKFFRYRFAGHPVILKRMEEHEKIPKRLKMYRYDIGEDETLLLALVSFSAAPDEPYGLDGLHPGVLPDDLDELSKTIYRVRYEAPQTYEKRAGEVLGGAEEDFSKGKYFESFLGYVEYTMQTGSIPESMKRKGSDLRRDENVKKYMAATEALPEGRSGAQKALAAFQQLRDAAIGHKQVIMAQEGDSQASLGNMAEARRSWLAVLEMNPYLAGVYMDLGNAYYREFNTLQAWRCWDLGRKLAPGSDMFKYVDDLEQRLLREYPDFF